MSLYDSVFQNNPMYNPPEFEKIALVAGWITKNKFKNVLDVGCGRGHYLPYTKAKGLEPFDTGVKNVIRDDLVHYSTKGVEYDALYCMDVLEHFSPHAINEAVEALTNLAPKAMLGIANHSDMWEGVELHLIQENRSWWEKLLKKYYKKVETIQNSQRFFVFEVKV